MSGSSEGGGPPPAKRRRREEVTVSDAKLMEQLASRVKREVALERASEEVEVEDEDIVEGVDVVLGPDGSPRIAPPPSTKRAPKR
ncbi:MAG TPA: hypothetical protein VGI39_05480 [Polyangiaceae bacterium]|jgi:hypothetical protein